MIHDLKCWPEPFQATWLGRKRHEVRKADRPFNVGDVLAMYEWDPKSETATGRYIVATVSYISEPGTFGLPRDLCVLSLDGMTKNWDRSRISAYPGLDAATVAGG